MQPTVAPEGLDGVDEGGAFLAELDSWMRWFREGRASRALGWLTPDEHRRSLGYPV